ncbi:MAG: SH3 domain-containing protein [Desulfobulbaceae bacterium]|nr:SH3 domain-containing protein [Desulfobulbaceae bacterium]
MKQITSKQIRIGLQAVAFIVTIGIALSAGAAEYVIAGKDGVNIRSAPNTKAEVLWEVFKNFPLQVLKREGQWTQTVDFEGDKGWVYDPLLSKEKMVIVKVDAANMRIGAGTNYEIVATVKYGVVFKPLEKDGEWIKVQHKDGTTGWLHQTLIWPTD